jgi:hypothetical protein
MPDGIVTTRNGALAASTVQTPWRDRMELDEYVAARGKALLRTA